MEVTILGSGSSGNCTLLQTEHTAILVDAGFSGRRTVQKLAPLGCDLADIDAIVVSHEHADHVAGLGAICKNHSMPVFANRLTAEAVQDELAAAPNLRIPWRIFTTGQPFEIGDLLIESFSIPHDAADPVGFTIRHRHLAIGIVTDLGHATKLVLERLRHLDLLILESNHDLKLLQDDPVRPWATKQRIMSRHGHLNNDAAAAVAAEIVTDRLRHLFLAHLSQDCNRPEIACRVVGQTLQHLGADHVQLATAHQDHPTATIRL